MTIGQRYLQIMTTLPQPGRGQQEHEYIIADFRMANLDTGFILKHSSEEINTERKSWEDILAIDISINEATFSKKNNIGGFERVSIIWIKETLYCSCSCAKPYKKLCPHQAHTLFGILYRHEFRVFFDQNLRQEKIRETAKDYGLQEEERPETFFDIFYENKSVVVRPKIKQLFPINQEMYTYLAEQWLPATRRNLPTVMGKGGREVIIIVLGKHKYYDYLCIDVYEAALGTNGKIKNPLQKVDPYEVMLQTTDNAVLKFYSVIGRFQNDYNAGRSKEDITALKVIWDNPLQLDVYYHDKEISEFPSAASLTMVRQQDSTTDIKITIAKAGSFYELTGAMVSEKERIDFSDLTIKLKYFVLFKDTWHLVHHIHHLHIIEFFKAHHHKLLIHRMLFPDFREQFLEQLGHDIRIHYAYLKPASTKQLREHHFEKEPIRSIYLGDMGTHISIKPVMLYGAIEVPVLSKKNIYATDEQGVSFLVNRDEETELRFLSMLLRQQEDFREQLDDGHDFFYVHRNLFLEQEWFLEVFEQWRDNGIVILGFNELKENKRNSHKANVSVNVSSGINWFHTTVTIQFGQQKASLKQVQKAVKNNSRFITLDDGSTGILPAVWIEKLAAYFEAGELWGETIRTAKMNFAAMETCYTAGEMDLTVRDELKRYRDKLAGFEQITLATLPKDLLTTLRPYQHHGLSWLCFLDEFHFGACLADDMGLGKTIQVIAFLLLQKERNGGLTNLIVMPTSLLFNWQQELAKFAPSLSVQVFYGNNRIKNNKGFKDYDIVLTTYGTVVSDINYLKKFTFNYVVLDESQAIKNVAALRHKAVSQLQQRNRIVLTGTPVENNTFDLYGQISFVCPGLLGTQQQFRDLYAIPIDKFKNDKRAAELQQKVAPFLLRRTKQEVAIELPEKTEMILYCPMGEEQRKVYKEQEQKIKEYISAQPEENLLKSSMYVLKGLTRLRQFCNATALLRDGLQDYGKHSAKLDILIKEIVRRSPFHKILVFSQFVGMLDLIRERLQGAAISFEYLSGQTKNRAQKVNNFQEDDSVRVFLISLKAGGTGLNLTQADYVYLVDPWWNPAVENQAIDRCYRIGQQKKVIAVRLITPDTVEEKIMKLQETKKGLVNNLIKTNEGGMPGFSKRDLMALLQ